MEQTVMNTWISLLEKRREEIRSRGKIIPDCIWDYVIELWKEGGAPSDPELCEPDFLVDVLTIHSDYGPFDDYRKPGESDEELITRMEKAGAQAIFPEEKFIYNY